MKSIFISHDADEDGAAAARLRDQLIESQPDDVVFLSSQPDAGPVGGTSWESWIVRTLKSCDVVVFIASAASHSPWCSAELGMARLLRKPIVPLHTGSTDHVNPLISQVQAAPLEQPIEVIVALIDARLGPRAEHAAVAADFVPFPGLVPLQDGMPLFGRTDERDRILDDIATIGEDSTGIVVVSGPSGSGKSSLVRAGLLHVLRTAGWAIVGPIQPSQVHREGTPELGDPGRQLLVVDQAEELYDLDVEARQRVEEWLRNTVADGVSLLVCLRIEFRNELGISLASTPERDMPKPVDHYIPFVDVHALDEIIRGPARLAQLDIDEPLIDRLVAETRTGEALPLLAYTLHLLWKARDREHVALRTATLDELGGVGGVLVTQAETALRRATGGDPTLHEPVLAVMSRLASPTHQPPTRSPMRVELLRHEERTWIDRFRDAGLVVYRRTYDIGESIEAGLQPSGDDLVDVTHEALFGWTPLRAAIDANRDDNTARQDIERTAMRWDEGERRDPTLLLGGDRLRFAIDAELADGDDEIMCAFVLTSTKNDRERRLRRALVGATAVVAAIAVFAAVFAVFQFVRANAERDRAEQAEVRAESIRVATQANAAIASARDLALLTGVAAYEIDANLDTEGALFNVLTTPRGPLRYFSDDTADWSTLQLIDNNRGVVVTADLVPATVDLVTRELTPFALDAPMPEIVGIEQGATDDMIVIRGRRPPVNWVVGVGDLATGTLSHIDHPVEVTVAIAHPLGVLFGDVDGGVYFAEVTNGSIRLSSLVDRHTRVITDLDTSASGEWLASASQAGVRVQQIRGGSWAPPTELIAFTGGRAAEQVAFRRDSSTDLFAAGGDPTLRRWSLVEGVYVDRDSPGEHPGVVAALAADPTAAVLYSGGVGGGIQRWDTERGAPIGDLLEAHRDDVVDIGTIGGTALLSTDANMAILWDLADARRVERADVVPAAWRSERFAALVNGNGPLAAITLDDRVLVSTGDTLTAPSRARKAWWVSDGSIVVESGDRGQVNDPPLTIWRVGSGVPQELASGLDAAAVGSCLAAIADGEAIRFLDVGACEAAPDDIPLGAFEVTELALSASEDRLLVVYRNNRIEEYLLADGALGRSAEPVQGVVATSAAWVNDNVVIVGHDRGAFVSVIEFGDDGSVSRLVLDDHDDAVWWLAVDEVGERLYTAGQDATIVQTLLATPARIGNPLIGFSRRTLNDTNADVHGLQLREHDGVLVAIHGSDIVAWELDPDELIANACSNAQRTLAPAEASRLGLDGPGRPCE